MAARHDRVPFHGEQARAWQATSMNSGIPCQSFFIPHRPTKLLIEPAACKSLKILEVASRALASLLITEREICGNRAENRAAHDATLATSLRFSLGERAKKIPTDKGWDFEYWWCVGNRRQTAYELLMRGNVGRCGALSFCFIKSGEVQFYFSSTAANQWRARRRL